MSKERELAMVWWNKQTNNHKKHITTYFETRDHTLLTGSEIENVYNKVNKLLKSFNNL